jgi:hypothetical protein
MPARMSGDVEVARPRTPQHQSSAIGSYGEAGQEWPEPIYGLAITARLLGGECHEHDR